MHEIDLKRVFPCIMYQLQELSKGNARGVLYDYNAHTIQNMKYIIEILSLSFASATLYCSKHYTVVICVSELEDLVDTSLILLTVKPSPPAWFTYAVKYVYTAQSQYSLYGSLMRCKHHANVDRCKPTLCLVLMLYIISDNAIFDYFGVSVCEWPGHLKKLYHFHVLPLSVCLHSTCLSAG